MYASIVEEIKVDVLHKKTLRIPVDKLNFYLLSISYSPSPTDAHVNVTQTLHQTSKNPRFPGIREIRLMSKMRKKR